ncbi:hypothetical protein [White-tailed deer poxvirus]|nr:hypothetical protein [White-tailed deer poxvirus]
MLNISALREVFLEQNCNTLSEAYKKLRINDAMRLIISGLHPTSLPKKWYSEIVESIPYKLYLFKPKNILYIDLISVIYSQKNIDIYKDHIAFHKNEIIQKCTKDIILKCIQYMIISDDDIRCLRSRFYDNDIDEMLININIESVKQINYIFSDSIVEKVFMQNYKMYDCMYKHQSFTNSFLLDMMYKYGIVPTNEGLLNKDISVDEAIDILSSIRTMKDTMSFMDLLSYEHLTHEKFKTHIINMINMGNIEQYKFYAEEYLVEEKEKLDIYSRIFFDEYDDNFLERFEHLNKDQLMIICKYIDRYEIFITYIINYLIKENHMDLLASIIDKIPEEILTEELCIRIICEANMKVPIKKLPIHSSLVMAMCIEMKYEDIVDLLDEIDIDILSEKNVDLVTDYTFTTNWYNENHKLLDIFVKKYGFCASKMNKLMFEYPLTTSSITYLLDLMENNKGATMFYPKKVCSLFYISCTRNKINMKKIPSKNLIIPSKKTIQNDKNSIKLSDPLHIRSTILYSNIPGIDLSFLEDMCYIKTSNGINIQINTDDNFLKDEKHILNQVYSIAKCASYGLFYVPYKYFPSWIPIVDILEGRDYQIPQKIEHGAIIKAYPFDFVEYKYLGNYVSNLYLLKEPVSNFHAVINSLIQTLLIYIVIGFKYSDSKEDEYIASLVDTFFTGMKINEILSEDVAAVCKELNLLREYIRDNDFVFVKKNSLNNTLNLCEKLCIAIVLDNN